MRRVSRLLLPLVVGALLPFALAAQFRTETHRDIDLQLLQQPHGELADLVFSSPSELTGDRDKVLRRGFLPLPSNTHRLNIDADLLPGAYAIPLREDRNHKLDHNFIGISRDPAGVTNNPRARFGPPPFCERLFHLADTGQTMTITLGNAS